MSPNNTFRLLAVISIAALSLCWISEPYYYDWQMLITNGVIGILVYDKFLQYKKQPDLKRGKWTHIIVGYVLAVCLLNIIDSTHFGLISSINHGLTDAGVLVRKQLDWERYICIYTVLAGFISIGFSTLLLTYVSIGDR